MKWVGAVAPSGAGARLAIVMMGTAIKVIVAGVKHSQEKRKSEGGRGKGGRGG